MRVLLMHNPEAGDAQHSSESLIAALEAAGHQARWRSTKERNWEDALDDPADLVVVAGGDGTVQKVFRQLAGKDVTATLIPVGTANNIARSVGFEDDDPARLIEGWPRGRMRHCDIASLTLPQGEVRFVESAGGGVFADVLARADEVEADPQGGDKIEQGLRMLYASLAEARALPWEVRLDGTDLSDELVALEVMNARETGPRIPLAPEADPADGILDAVLIRAKDASNLATYVEARLDGRSPEPPPFEVRRGLEIVFSPPRGCALHFDDEVLTEGAAHEAAGTLTARAASKLQVLVPAAPPR